MNKFIICPNCQNEMKFYLDEWGYTPWHLHCEVCNINIGTSNQKKAIDLIQKYHFPETWIEYYANEIQILCINGKYIINKAGA